MGQVSPGLVHLGLLQSSKHTHKSQTHSGLPQCHSRQSLQEGQIIQTEWSLHPQIFSLICIVWHKPMVDMFATKLNHKLPIPLVLGSCESVNQTPITTISLSSSVKTTVQSEVPSESHVSESACLAPRHHSESLDIIL